MIIISIIGDLMVDWKPRTHEDNLIYQYWKEVGGTFFLEVPIGSQRGNVGWPKGSGIRRIDAIRINSDNDQIIPQKEFNYSKFCDIVENQLVELIEAKQKLNRLVIGQIIAGYDMFECEYSSKNILNVILCFKGDPALEWVCKKRNIQVNIIK